MNLEEKIDEMLKMQYEMKDDISSLQGNVTTLTEDVTELKGDVATLKENVSILTEDVAELKGDVAILKENISTLTEDVTELKSDVTTLKKDVALTNKKIDNFDKRIMVLEDSHEQKLNLIIEMIKAQNEAREADKKEIATIFRILENNIYRVEKENNDRHEGY